MQYSALTDKELRRMYDVTLAPVERLGLITECAERYFKSKELETPKMCFGCFEYNENDDYE